MSRVFTVLGAVVLSVFAFSGTALAKPATLTVSQTWSSNASGVMDTFVYEVVPTDSESVPLDGAGSDGAYRFSMRQEQTVSLSFPSPASASGVGHYELRRASDVPSGTGWSTVGGPYAIEVVEDGAGGFCALVVDDDGSKGLSASFSYRYRGESEPKQEKPSIFEFLPSTGNVSFDAVCLLLLGVVVVSVGVFCGRRS